MTVDKTTLGKTSPHDFRLMCRDGSFATHTSGVSRGYAQANLLVIPKEYEQDFTDLCFRNAVPCPLLAKTPAGNPHQVDDKRIISDPDFDIRTDFPAYNVYENGVLVETKSNILDEWTDDYVGFLIGCSQSFEAQLASNGLAARHEVMGTNVSMFKTTRYLDTAGIFVNCQYVVSMRPYKLDQIEKVREITRAFRKTHGEPLDWGYDGAKRLGIQDVTKPDFGDPIKIEDDEVPVFWGCGVTPQNCVMALGKKIKGKVMSHAPGHMLILDTTDEGIASLELR